MGKESDSKNSSNSDNYNELTEQMKHDTNSQQQVDKFNRICPLRRQYYYLIEDYFAAWSWSG